MNRTRFAVLSAAVLCISCGNNNQPSNPAPVDMGGTVWKIVVAQENRTVISQGPKRTVGNLYGDSASIAGLGTEFGRFNRMAFLTIDSLRIYGSTVTDTFPGGYSAYGSTISATVVTSDTTLHLVLNKDAYNQLWLDFPAVKTAYYMPGMGMTVSSIFGSLAERDGYIATLDTAFHAATMDSIVYTTVMYAYIEQ